MTLLTAVVILLCGVAIVTGAVEREADYLMQSLGGDGEPKALILYHPSRAAHFTDELSIASRPLVGSPAPGRQLDHSKCWSGRCCAAGLP